jgi:hypothetical protein
MVVNSVARHATSGLPVGLHAVLSKLSSCFLEAQHADPQAVLSIADVP